MTPKEAFEYITNFDVENGSVCIKDIKKYQECCDIVEKAIDRLDFIKKHYIMNAFDELLPSYLEDNDEEEYYKLGKWLENDR